MVWVVVCWYCVCCLGGVFFDYYWVGWCFDFGGCCFGYGVCVCYGDCWFDIGLLYWWWVVGCCSSFELGCGLVILFDVQGDYQLLGFVIGGLLFYLVGDCMDLVFVIVGVEDFGGGVCGVGFGWCQLDVVQYGCVLLVFGCCVVYCEYGVDEVGCQQGVQLVYWVVVVDDFQYLVQCGIGEGFCLMQLW